MVDWNEYFAAKESALVSVVIPCFNRADVIARAVASVLSQTYHNLEVIVVDDGSEDILELKETLDAFGDERISLIQQPHNQGGAVARNVGVTRSRGEFIAFLDSDDEWLPDKLEKQLSMADATQDRLIYSASTVITVQGKEERRSRMPLRGIEVDERIGDYLFLNRGFLPTPAMLLPRWLALQVPFNGTLPRHQDYDFLLRLEQSGCEFVMCPDELVVVHWEDLHQTGRGLNAEGSLDFLANYKQFLSKRAHSAFIVQQIVTRLLRSGRRVEGVRVLFGQVNLFHLPLVELLNLLSLFLFTDTRIMPFFLGVKKILRVDGNADSKKGSNGDVD